MALTKRRNPVVLGQPSWSIEVACAAKWIWQTNSVETARERLTHAVRRFKLYAPEVFSVKCGRCANGEGIVRVNGTLALCPVCQGAGRITNA